MLFSLFPLRFSGQPAGLYSWISNDEGQKEGQMERKTKFSPSLFVIITITDLASSGSWCLVQGSRGSGVSITHNSWLVVRQRTATQLHFPFITSKDSRLKTVCVCVCVCVHLYTYLVHCLHSSALLSAEKKPFLHATQTFLPLTDSGIRAYIVIYL